MNETGTGALMRICQKLKVKDSLTAGAAANAVIRRFAILQNDLEQLQVETADYRRMKAAKYVEGNREKRVEVALCLDPLTAEEQAEVEELRRTLPDLTLLEARLYLFAGR